MWPGAVLRANRGHSSSSEAVEGPREGNRGDPRVKLLPLSLGCFLCHLFLCLLSRNWGFLSLLLTESEGSWNGGAWKL